MLNVTRNYCGGQLQRLAGKVALVTASTEG